MKSLAQLGTRTHDALRPACPSSLACPTSSGDGHKPFKRCRHDFPAKSYIIVINYQHKHMTIDYCRYSSIPCPFMACKLKINCFMAKHSYTFYLACMLYKSNYHYFNPVQNRNRRGRSLNQAKLVFYFVHELIISYACTGIKHKNDKTVGHSLL